MNGFPRTALIVDDLMAQVFGFPVVSGDSSEIEVFRSLFDQAADGIFVHDESESIIDANPAFCGMVGYSRDESVAFETLLIKADGSTLGVEVSTKRVLLRELYHRTKSNMQVISSILELKKHSIANEQVGLALEDINSRILAMSLVHRELYESQSLSSINLRDYLVKLSGLLESLYSQASKRVTVLCSGVEHMVLIDIAVPVGQIVTELVSNSVKHAFAGGDDGRIRIELSEGEDGLLVLEYRDNGAGFPADFAIQSHANLGMRTVRLMAENQLGGAVTVLPNDDGARVRVEFRESGYGDRV